MNNEIQFLLYNSPEGGENVQVLVKDETLWMTQKAISQLFDCTVDNVGLHLRNIFQGRRIKRNINYREILGSSKRRKT